MRAPGRWVTFNLVGVAGMGVQLGALWVFSRCMAGHSLWASAAALEVAVLHNFAWHRRYTWAERRDHSSGVRQFVRFQMSNGMVSLAGNLLLMRVLVRGAHWPVVAANAAAIGACAMLNFGLAEWWAFRRAGRRDRETSRVRAMAVCVLVLLLGGVACAQGGVAALPPAPLPQYHAPFDESYLDHVGVLCGVGASRSGVGTVPAAGCGAGMTLLPLPVFVELGIMGPQANRSKVTGYVSLDGSIPLEPQASRYLPMAIVGYSRLFETGHALDYGLALALPRPGKRRDGSLRIELRDYWTFANPAQHNVMLRVGWMGVETD